MENKEYLENILVLILTGEEENFEIADTFVQSLNLHNEFKEYINKERDKKKEKLCFVEKTKHGLLKQYYNNNFDFELFDKSDKELFNKTDKEFDKLEEELKIIQNFLFFFYWKKKTNHYKFTE